MRRAIRRGLFWRVYFTLLASLVIVAVLGAGLAHLLARWPMGANIGSRAHAMRAHGEHILSVLLVVAAIVGCVAYPVVASITRRLEALRLSVEAWGAGELSRRAAIEGRDEIAAVAASFNAAAERTQTLLAAHKSLLAHASHELRSPLTRLGIAAEMPVGGSQPNLAAVRREIAELDGLVEEILLASRLDHGADIGEQERVDCLALAAEEAARAAIAVSAVSDGSAAFEVMGSPRLLRRLVRNLIDNAVKHGGPPIEIELGRGIGGAGPSITIAVHDHGPGIPASLRERVFEPFFRPGDRTEETGSWGLGLSLVRQIARRHAGDVACFATQGVTTFAVELPTGLAALVG